MPFSPSPRDSPPAATHDDGGAAHAPAHRGELAGPLRDLGHTGDPSTPAQPNGRFVPPSDRAGSHRLTAAVLG